MKGEGECGGAEDKDRAGKGDKGGASIAADTLDNYFAISDSQ